jgi:hypothetical protein
MYNSIEEIIEGKFKTVKDLKNHCKEKLTSDEYRTMRADLNELKKMLNNLVKEMKDKEAVYDYVVSVYSLESERLVKSAGEYLNDNKKYAGKVCEVSALDVYKSFCFVEVLAKKMLLMIRGE